MAWSVWLEGSWDGNHEIYVTNTDGTGLTRLTDNSSTDIYPSWTQ